MSNNDDTTDSGTTRKKVLHTDPNFKTSTTEPTNDSDDENNNKTQNKCFRCGKTGHFVSECPEEPTCKRCGETGHLIRDCPKADERECFNCRKTGHISKDCPEEQRPRPSGDAAAATHIPDDYSYEKELAHYLATATGKTFDPEREPKVSKTGEQCPDELNTFEEMGFSEQFMINIKALKYQVPTPVQKHAIPIIADGRDLMACAETGSGKTAAFLLPLMNYLVESESTCQAEQKKGATEVGGQPRILILAPTRELARQIMMDAMTLSYKTGLRCLALYGGVETKHCMAQLRGGVDILVATCGRLRDFICRGFIRFPKLLGLVLDEADRMLDSSGFHDDVTAVLSSIKEHKKGAEEGDHVQTIGLLGAANQDVSQHLIRVDDVDKPDKLDSLVEENKDKKVIVFVETQRTCEQLALQYQQQFEASANESAPVRVFSLHGNRTQAQREDALRSFKASEGPGGSLLLATSVAARGLDIPKVDVVINHDLPSDVHTYVHRIGRTGRMGRRGQSISFFDVHKDTHLAPGLLDKLAAAHQEVPDWLEEIARDAEPFGTSRFDRRGGRDRSGFSGPGDFRKTRRVFQAENTTD